MSCAASVGKGSAGCKDDAVDQATIDIAAPPEAVYDLVADVTKMGQWSPETYKCEWLDGCTGPRVDARFKGWNRDALGPIPIKWSTVNTIRTAARGEEFSFQTRDSGATWTYRFDATTDGTKVTEERVDGQKPLIAKIFNAIVPRRDEKLVAGMHATLERIKAAAEAAA